MQSKRQRKLLRRAEKQGRREQRLQDRTLQPSKTDAEVYMSRHDTYHEHWCSAMNGVWLSGSQRIEVVPRDCAGVDDARPCRLCQAISEAMALDSHDMRYA